ncbi:MAG: 16S rRNA (cytidine(1402)-2'-O)-methyltransferase [Paracoccus sp. (in: a-proteobacteria)]|uniref:16S rRNA (cytidine(1402)-2'-O)-methyltransferase n=1 Tax=Paracoccus sp. TaxID=267 RepID=UPI0026E0CA48|nr:16S rRNA (cytidine(1402)-2'-O)-methyltransferase [Paracoccus sp. (in: a-proteobacteria)]MDO5621038.1 16S rRNA (cytidine(1402)-2'-O)-methyltransferase [Paracoccus sp. (in: a-proteobacteria)]
MLATPIGTARDITLRALDVLNSADILAAEDTRRMRHLLDIQGVPLRGRRIVAYHDHNEAKAGPELLAALAEGCSVAYASDAGTPLVADPGFRLGREALAAGYRVHAVPGASAALAALTVSGLPSDKFLFAGFPPVAKSARRRWLQDWTSHKATAIIFESPRRINQTLEIFCETIPEREMVLCRELTKRFEEVMRGTAADIRAKLPDDGPKGEIVLLVGAAPDDVPVAADVDALLRDALARLSLRDASDEVAARLGMKRREVYTRALELGKEE